MVGPVWICFGLYVAGLGDLEGLTFDLLFYFPIIPNLLDLWIVEKSYIRFECLILPRPWVLINIIMTSFLFAHSKILNEWYFHEGVFLGVHFSQWYVNGLGLIYLSLTLPELDYWKGYICLQRSKPGMSYTLICILYRILSHFIFRIYFLFFIISLNEWFRGFFSFEICLW